MHDRLGEIIESAIESFGGSLIPFIPALQIKVAGLVSFGIGDDWRADAGQVLHSSKRLGLHYYSCLAEAPSGTNHRQRKRASGQWFSSMLQKTRIPVNAQSIAMIEECHHFGALVLLANRGDDMHSHAIERPALFGLLPETERSHASFLISFLFNAAILTTVILVGTLAREQIRLRTMETTEFVFPAAPPSPKSRLSRCLNAVHPRRPKS